MAERVPTVDTIEMAGSLVESGALTLMDASRVVVDHTEGGLTLLDAMSLVQNWRSARQDYEWLLRLGPREEG